MNQSKVVKAAKNDDHSSMFESSLVTSSSMFDGSPSHTRSGAHKKTRMSKHTKVAFGDMKMLEQIHTIQQKVAEGKEEKLSDNKYIELHTKALNKYNHQKDKWKLLAKDIDGKVEFKQRVDHMAGMGNGSSSKKQGYNSTQSLGNTRGLNLMSKER